VNELGWASPEEFGRPVALLGESLMLFWKERVVQTSYFKGRASVVLMTVALAAAVGAFANLAAAGLPPVDLTRMDPASNNGFCQRPDSEVAIRGKVYDGYIGFCWYGDTEWATWRVPSGYATFQAYVGIDDESRRDKASTFRVLIDGDLAKSVKVEPGSKAVQLSLAVPPGSSLRLEMERRGGVFAEPRLLAGPAHAATTPEAGGGTASALSPFVVDPRDIDRLAASLRQKVDANAVVRQRLANGQVAVSTFSLIDVSSPSVAQNVAEDLYTAMINSGFALVERGQLDKVLRELKIQNMGLVDPKTALKIGQLSGCDVILLGSISDRGQFVAINARLMDTATGKSLVADRIEMRKMPIQRGG